MLATLEGDMPIAHTLSSGEAFETAVSGLHGQQSRASQKREIKCQDYVPMLFRDKEKVLRSKIAKSFNEGWKKSERALVADYDKKNLLTFEGPENNVIVYHPAQNFIPVAIDAEGRLDHALLADVAADFISSSFEAHTSLLARLKNENAVAGRDLVIKNIFFDKNIKPNIRRQTRELRERIRFAIYHVAELLVSENFKSLSYMEKLTVTNDVKQRQRAHNLVRGEYEFHVSYRSLAAAAEIFARVNERLKKEVSHAQTASGRASAIDTQTRSALLVYEFLDVIIGHLRNFQLGGEATLRALHRDILSDLQTSEKDDRDLEQRMAAVSNQEAIAGTRLSLEGRNEARRMIREKWADYLNNISSAGANAKKFGQKVNVLEIKRDNARNQIGIMEAVRLTVFAEENIDAIQMLLDLDGIEVDILAPQDFASLLNIQLQEPRRLEKS